MAQVRRNLSTLAGDLRRVPKNPQTPASFQKPAQEDASMVEIGPRHGVPLLQIKRRALSRPSRDEFRAALPALEITNHHDVMGFGAAEKRRGGRREAMGTSPLQQDLISPSRYPKFLLAPAWW
jgi:hypothetical protein